jgi:hypothetical protein
MTVIPALAAVIAQQVPDKPPPTTTRSAANEQTLDSLDPVAFSLIMYAVYIYL